MDSTIKKGRLGYNLVEKELLKRNWDIYLPIVEDTKIDCIAIKNHDLEKMQIKTLIVDIRNGKKFLPVRKISHNQGRYKISYYTDDDVDYFLGVDLETDDIYVVPINFTKKYKSAISTNKLKPFLNNWTQLEPVSGNINSVGDDIGERLTANTEGMGNQPVESR